MAVGSKPIGCLCNLPILKERGFIYHYWGKDNTQVLVNPESQNPQTTSDYHFVQKNTGKEHDAGFKHI